VLGGGAVRCHSSAAATVARETVDGAARCHSSAAASESSSPNRLLSEGRG
jgi:hypothetical protein